MPPTTAPRRRPIAWLCALAILALALVPGLAKATAFSRIAAATHLAPTSPVGSTHLPHSRAGRVALHAPEHEFGGGRPPAAPKARGWAGGGNATLLEEVAYDNYGRLTAKVDGSSEGYRYSYDARGNLIESVDPHGLKRRFEYEQDRVVRDIAADGQVTHYRYEQHGALSWVQYPTGETYQFEYDTRGRLTRAAGPRGTIAEYSYDSSNNVVAEVDARGARTDYSYDAVGRPTSRTDALKHTTRVRYDAAGRRSALELSDGTTRRFEHDSAGRLSAVTNGLGQTTRMTYSGIAALARVELPDGRAYELIHNQQEKLLALKNPLSEEHSYERDAAGRVVTEHTFDGRDLTYSYAAGGKLARIDYPNATFRSFEYSARGDLIAEQTADLQLEYERDLHGRLMKTRSSGWNENVATEFERDANGRVIAELQEGRRIAYQRSVEGLVTERVLPNGAKTQYQYDTAGALSAVVHDGFHLEFERDAVGREIGRNANRAVRVEQKYDSLDRLLERRVVVPEPGAGIGSQRVASRRGYRYDRAGRLENIDDARWGTTNYRYDAAGRLLESRQQLLQETFEHDAADSIIGWVTQLGADGSGAARSAPKQEKAQVGPGNVLLRRGTTEYRYDARGRRTAKIALDKDSKQQTTLYDWDGRDRLRRILRPDGVQLNYSYDAFGRRVHKMRRAADGAISNNNFVWDGEVLAAELDDQRGPRAFVHEPGGFEPILQQQGGETFLCVNDHLGMPKDLVSGDGLVVWTAAHSAYGRVIAVDADLAAKARYGESASATAGARGTATGIESPFRLLGQVADEDAEIGWTRFRCFDAESGAWLSPDPLGLKGGIGAFGFDGAPNAEVDPLGLSTSTGTPHTVVTGGKAVRAPSTGTPNSIYEHRRPDGAKSVTYYDDKGRAFSREDYGQPETHGVLGTGPDGRSVSHEHRVDYSDKGPIGKRYRELDADGRPVGPWHDD